MHVGLCVLYRRRRDERIVTANQTQRDRLTEVMQGIHQRGCVVPLLNPEPIALHRCFCRRGKVMGSRGSKGWRLCVRVRVHACARVRVRARVRGCVGLFHARTHTHTPQASTHVCTPHARTLFETCFLGRPRSWKDDATEGPHILF